MNRLMISKGGQVSVPAAVRHRWNTRAVVAEEGNIEVVGRTDPINDTINPLFGMRVPALNYSFPNADILRWSLTANRDDKTLVAEMTMNGPWSRWVEQPAWGTFPFNAITFTSPALRERCEGCDARFGKRRFVIAFYPTGCWMHEFETAVGIYDPVLRMFEPLAVGTALPFKISADQRTVSVTVPYGLSRSGIDPVPAIATSGDVLGDITAASFIRDGQGVYSASFCAIAYNEEGLTDWSPDLAWNPLLRVFVPSGISVTA